MTLFPVDTALKPLFNTRLWTLESLPDEILRTIAHLGGPKVVSKLFCVGDSVLLAKLSSSYGINEISLSERYSAHVTWFPSFLGGLTGLRTLKLEVGFWRIGSLSGCTRQLLQQLPSSLETISFRFKECISCWFTDPNVDSTAPDLDFDFGTHFPRLRSLQLANSPEILNSASATPAAWQCEADPMLDKLIRSITHFCPSHLSSLWLPAWTSGSKEMLNELPVTLIDLKLGLTEVSGVKWVSRLFRLETLSMPFLHVWRTCPDEEISEEIDLPESLTRFELPECTELPKVPHWFSQLHGLHALSVRASSPELLSSSAHYAPAPSTDVALLSATYPAPVESDYPLIPQSLTTLTELSIPCVNWQESSFSDLKQRFPNLYRLELLGMCTWLEPTDLLLQLPQNLRVLKLPTCKVPLVDESTLIPRNVTELSCQWSTSSRAESIAFLHHLPASVTFLHTPEPNNNPDMAIFKAATRHLRRLKWANEPSWFRIPSSSFRPSQKNSTKRLKQMSIDSPSNRRQPMANWMTIAKALVLDCSTALEHLIQAGAELEEPGEAALAITAARNGSLKCLKWMYSVGLVSTPTSLDDSATDILHIAAQSGHAKIVAWLVKELKWPQHYSRDFGYPIAIAARNSDDATMRVLMESLQNPGREDREHHLDRVRRQMEDWGFGSASVQSPIYILLQNNRTDSCVALYKQCPVPEKCTADAMAYVITNMSLPTLSLLQSKSMDFEAHNPFHCVKFIVAMIPMLQTLFGKLEGWLLVDAISAALRDDLYPSLFSILKEILILCSHHHQIVPISTISEWIEAISAKKRLRSNFSVQSLAQCAIDCSLDPLIQLIRQNQAQLELNHVAGESPIGETSA